MSDETNQNGSPMGSRRLFGGTGGESVPDWMTAIHQALANTPPAFRTTVNRALNTAVTTDSTFNVMMAEEAENIAQAAQPAPQNRGVTIMTPEEQTAALSLSALRGGVHNQAQTVLPQQTQMLHQVQPMLQQVQPATVPTNQCQRPHQH